MDDSGRMREDIRLPEDGVGEEIERRFEKEEQFMVTVLSACQKEQAVAARSMKQTHSSYSS